MSNFIELTFNGKPILVNTDHIISIAPLDSGDVKSLTVLLIDQCSYWTREPTSAAPIFEIIRPNPLKIHVSENYATVKGLLKGPD